MHPAGAGRLDRAQRRGPLVRVTVGQGHPGHRPGGQRPRADDPPADRLSGRDPGPQHGGVPVTLEGGQQREDGQVGGHAVVLPGPASQPQPFQRVGAGRRVVVGPELGEGQELQRDRQLRGRALGAGLGHRPFGQFAAAHLVAEGHRRDRGQDQRDRVVGERGQLHHLAQRTGRLVVVTPERRGQPGEVFEHQPGHRGLVRTAQRLEPARHVQETGMVAGQHADLTGPHQRGHRLGPLGAGMAADSLAHPGQGAIGLLGGAAAQFDLAVQQVDQSTQFGGVGQRAGLVEQHPGPPAVTGQPCRPGGRDQPLGGGTSLHSPLGQPRNLTIQIGLLTVAGHSGLQTQPTDELPTVAASTFTRIVRDPTR